MCCARLTSSRTSGVLSTTVTATVWVPLVRPSGARSRVVPVAPGMGLPFSDHWTSSACAVGSTGSTNSTALDG